MYEVRTDKYNGPLDVLLQLIEEQSLSINDISLAAVTQQFLEHLRTLIDISPDLLADFLTVASKLLVIKSKALLPSLEQELGEDESATDLTQQLLAYKRFKEVAKYLRTLESKRRYMFVREGTIDIPASYYPDPTLTVDRLKAAMEMLARSLAEITQLPRQVVKEVISIKQKIVELQARITEKIELKLSDAIKNKSRTETIVTFLALLELIKQRILTVEQEALFADIRIRRQGAASSNI